MVNVEASKENAEFEDRMKNVTEAPQLVECLRD